MAQFIDGLNERIAGKVERLQYGDIYELKHLAVQAEQQIKRKTHASTRARPTQAWVPLITPMERGKTPEVDNKGKGKEVHSSRIIPYTNAPNVSHSRYITCFKCQGKGHMTRECPNKRVMILTPNGEYESCDEQEEEEAPEDIEYPEVGELLVSRRVMNMQVGLEDTMQRENIFHTKCQVKDKVVTSVFQVSDVFGLVDVISLCVMIVH